MKQYQKGISLLLATCLFVLCGCGTSDTDQLKREMDAVKLEQNEEVKEQEKGTELALNYEIPLANGAKMIKVMATVDTDHDTGTIYQANTHDYTEESIRGFAKKIFDEGQYEVLKSPTVCEMDELITICSQYEDEAVEIISDSGRDAERYFDTSLTVTGSLNILQYYQMEYRDREEQKNPEPRGTYDSEKIYQSNLQLDVEKMEVILIGKIKGKKYVLLENIEKKKDFVGAYGMNLIPCEEVHDATEVGDIVDLEQPEENECDLEMALTKAESFLKDLGYENWGLVEVTNRKRHLDYKNAGYSFVFAPIVDGNEQLFFDNGFLAAYDGETLGSTCNQKGIKVTVDNEGVAFLTIYDFTDVGEAIQKQVKLMDYEEIDQIFRENIGKIHRSYYNTFVKEILFGYVTVSYGKEGNVFLPVYLYTCDRSSAGEFQSRNAILAISAVDGQIYVPFNNGELWWRAFADYEW